MNAFKSKLVNSSHRDLFQRFGGKSISSTFIDIFSCLGKNKQLENMLGPKFHAQKLFDNLRAPISCVAPQQHEGIRESDIIS